MSTTPYLQQDPWAALMRRRLWGFGGLAFSILGVILIFRSGFRPAGFVAILVGLVLTTYGEWAKCPHCGKKFARRGAFHNSFTRKCLNCGVKIGTPKTAR